MKPNPTRQEVVDSERKMRLWTLLGLVFGKALTAGGRRLDLRTVRICGRLVFGFSVLSALTLVFTALIAHNDRKQEQAEELETQRFEKLRGQDPQRATA